MGIQNIYHIQTDMTELLELFLRLWTSFHLELLISHIATKAHLLPLTNVCCVVRNHEFIVVHSCKWDPTLSLSEAWDFEEFLKQNGHKIHFQKSTFYSKNTFCRSTHFDGKQMLPVKFLMVTFYIKPNVMEALSCKCM